MNSPENGVYYDKPKPSLPLRLLLIFFFVVFLGAVPIILLTDSFSGYQGLIIGPLLMFESVILYAFWLINNISYTINQAGLTVKFGSLITDYNWDEFREAFWRKGLFAGKIGWRHISPCVRLSNALVLRRKETSLPLFLTPTDPGDFLDRIRKFRPDLVQEFDKG